MNVREMEAALATSDGRDYYELLGISRTTGRAAIETAWMDRVQGCHPDRHPEGVARDTGTRLTKLYNEAYQALRDPGRRSLYDEGLRASPPRLRLDLAARPTGERAAAKPKNGAGRFLLQSLAAERKGDLKAARTFISLARRLDPKNIFFVAKEAELAGRLREPFRGLAPR